MPSGVAVASSVTKLAAAVRRCEGLLDYIPFMNKLTFIATLAGASCLISPPAAAQVTSAAVPETQQTRLEPAFEFNVLWPFFPGGFTDFKFMLPTFAQGEAIFGLHSDFGWRAREKDAGKVAVLAAKLGYRQFIFDGIHLDTTVNVGWRQERDNPYDGTTLNGFVGRFWGFGGYQYDLSEQWYVNARGGVGIHLWRTDKFSEKERVFIPAGDINVGVRF